MRERSRKFLYNQHLDLDSNRIHIVSEVKDDFEVWLNTEVGDFDGLCISCGKSREEAVADAIGVFEQGLRKLRQEQPRQPDTGTNDIS